jgi:hypothetical protein
VSKTKRRACQKNQPEFHALNRTVAIHVAIQGDSAIGRSLTARRAGLSWKLDQGAVIAEHHPRALIRIDVSRGACGKIIAPGVISPPRASPT